MIGKLKALVNINNLKNTVTLLGKRLSGKTIEIEAEGNGRKIKIKISHPEDLAQVMPIVDNFIKG